ncbi:hypothetical protein [Paraglaciecola marina]|uniref:hypothetical protein n=1 Tax=Paraglaciecola marina TaxID=2500157 RepID=UPI00105CA53B|nr:hypothetical protein [Paraglaciecola marina]
MFKPLSKLLIITSLLIAFVGQAMGSYVVTFDDARTNQQVNTQQLDADEAGDNHGITEKDDCCDVDCCEDQCFCPANACVAMIYLDNTVTQSCLKLISEFALPYTQKSPHYIATSLYRPPIFTS